MSKTIKVALAGAGAFGIKHLDGIKNIDGVEVVSLISRELEKTKEVASKFGIQHVTTKLEDSLALPEVDAVIDGVVDARGQVVVHAEVEAGDPVQLFNVELHGGGIEHLRQQHAPLQQCDMRAVPGGDVGDEIGGDAHQRDRENQPDDHHCGRGRKAGVERWRSRHRMAEGFGEN